MPWLGDSESCPSLAASYLGHPAPALFLSTDGKLGESLLLNPADDFRGEAWALVAEFFQVTLTSSKCAWEP